MTEQNRWLVMEGAELLYDSPVCVTRLDEIACPMTPFQERVRQLCKQVVVCKTEAEAAELAQQLRALLHDRIEQLRDNLGNMRKVMNLLNAPILIPVIEKSFESYSPEWQNKRPELSSSRSEC